MVINTNGTERMRLDSAGNLGLGVTPNPWTSAIGIKALQVGGYGAHIFGTGTGWSSNPFIYIGNNAYHGDGAWRYSSSKPSAQYVQSANQHLWYLADAGTAGSPITFNNVMGLYSNGALIVSGLVQASAFQDVDNTAYYLDPANTGTSMAVAGNVGIGTTSPAALLHLYKNSSTKQASLRLQNASTAVGSYATVLLDAGAVTSQLYSDAGGGTGTQGTVLRTTSNHPLMFGTNGIERMRISADGNLTVTGNVDAASFRDSSNTAYYLDPANTGTSLNVAGSVVAAGNVTAYSDIRVKANIEPIHGALDKLAQINGVTYTRTDLDDKERRYGGVIAQEIEAVLPEAVFDNGDKKAVDYNATIGLLIEAVKEQQAQILELKLEIQQLKGN